MASLDLGDTFNSLFSLNPGNTGNPDQRVALVFTSTLRERLNAEIQENINATNAAIVGGNASATGIQVFSSIFQTQVAKAMPRITMALNPKSVRFEQPKRYTKKDTRSGSVFFHFTNTKGQNNDILTMRFQGNTGNIDLHGTFDAPEKDPGALQSGTAIDAQRRAEQDTGAFRKLMVWHNLYLLSREPMLLDDNTENVFRITYVSQLFPRTIEFSGFFAKVLDFEENAAKPNSRDYSFDFIVTSTEPDLDDLVNEIFDFVQTTQNLQPSETATLLGTNSGLSE